MYGSENPRTENELSRKIEWACDLQAAALSKKNAARRRASQREEYARGESFDLDVFVQNIKKRSAFGKAMKRATEFLAASLLFAVIVVMWVVVALTHI